MNFHGMVHLYVGNGKGKTTAATGLAVRALGCGRRVLFAQFLKSGPTGELEPLRHLGATVLRAKHGDKFTFQMTSEELCQAALLHREFLEQISAAIKVDDYSLVVLDEVVDAVNAGLIPLDSLILFITARPQQVELVLTGRNPAAELCALADYHTDFVCIKHPYQQGVAAREGVEY